MKGPGGFATRILLTLFGPGTVAFQGRRVNLPHTGAHPGRVDQRVEPTMLGRIRPGEDSPTRNRSQVAGREANGEPRPPNPEG